MSEHPAVAHLLAAHAEAERLAKAAGGPDGWWVIEPRFTNPIFEVGRPRPEPADAVIHSMQGGNPVAYIEIGDVDTAKRKAETLLIQGNNPRAVLLRVAAERELLAEHAGTWASGEPEYDHHHEVVVGANGRTRYIEVDDDDPIQPYMCITCEVGGWPCRTVLGLAKAWGWEEQHG